jgi:hypothetical protein
MNDARKRAAGLLPAALLAAACAALAPPARADYFHWIGAGTGGNTATDPADPTTQWNYPANWQEGQPPSPTDTPLLPLANAGYVNAASCVVKGLRVDGPSADGALRIADGADVATASGSGVNVGLFANGRVIQTGGSLTVNGLFRIGADVGGNGSYLLEGGALTVPGISDYESIGEFGTGVFTQTGGTLIVQSTMYVGRMFGNGVLNMGGGTLRVRSLYLGDAYSQAALNITDSAARIEITGGLHFGTNSTLSAVPGSTIHLPGTSLTNLSNDEVALRDLANLTLVLDGAKPSLGFTMEVAGKDYGALPIGFYDNFALGSLVIGEGTTRWLWLEDKCDNGNRTSAEALYVHNITIGPGSELDLNALHVYYDGAFINQGIVTGGMPIFVPEPGCVALLCLGLAAIGGRRIVTRGRNMANLASREGRDALSRMPIPRGTR